MWLEEWKQMKKWKENPFHFQDENLEHYSKMYAARDIYPSVTSYCFLKWAASLHPDIVIPSSFLCKESV